MSPFGVYPLQCGMRDSARLQLAQLEQEKTTELTQDLTLPVTEELTKVMVEGWEYETRAFPAVSELVTPERVIEKMVRGEWESALRMLEISTGLK